MNLIARVVFDELPFSGALSGQTPSFNFGGERKACRLDHDVPGFRPQIGVPVELRIQLLYTSPADEGVRKGAAFQLCVGGNDFANGTVLDC